MSEETLSTISKKIAAYWSDYQSFEAHWNTFQSNINTMTEEGPVTTEAGDSILRMSRYYEITDKTDRSFDIIFCGTAYQISFVYYENRSVILHKKRIKNNTDDTSKMKVIGKIWFDNKSCLYPDHKEKGPGTTMFDTEGDEKQFQNGGPAMLMHLSILYDDLAKRRSIQEKAGRGQGNKHKSRHKG